MILPSKEKFAKVDNPKLPSKEKIYAELSQLTLPSLEKIIPTVEPNYTLCSLGNNPEVKKSTPPPKSSLPEPTPPEVLEKILDRIETSEKKLKEYPLPQGEASTDPKVQNKYFAIGNEIHKQTKLLRNYIIANGDRDFNPKAENLINSQISRLEELLDSPKFNLRQTGSSGLKKIISSLYISFKPEKIIELLERNRKADTEDKEVEFRFKGIEKYVKEDLFGQALDQWAKQYHNSNLNRIQECLEIETAGKNTNFSFFRDIGLRYIVALESSARSGVPENIIEIIGRNIDNKRFQSWFTQRLMDNNQYKTEELIRFARNPQEGDPYYSNLISDLAKRQIPNFEDLLVEVLNNKSQKNHHGEVLKELENLGSNKGRDVALELLNSEERQIKTASLSYLVSLKDEQSSEYIRKVLNDGDSEAMKDMIWYLPVTELTLPILEEVIENKNLDKNVRTHAMWKMNESPEKLWQYLDHSDPSVSEAALSSLGSSKTEKAYNYLLDKLKNEKDEHQLSIVCGSIYAAYDQWNVREVHDIMIDRLKSAQTDELISSITSPLRSIPISQLDEEKVAPEWLELLKHENPTISGEAVSQFRHIRSEEAVPLLQDFAENSKMPVYTRYQAALALGDMGFKSARPWALEIYNETNKEANISDLKGAADYIIEKIGISDDPNELKMYILGDDKFLSYIALNSLVENKSPEAISLLLEIANSTDSPKRISAIAGLIRKGDNSQSEVVVEMLSSKKLTPEELSELLDAHEDPTAKNISVLSHFVGNHWIDYTIEDLSNNPAKTAIEILSKMKTDASIRALMMLDAHCHNWEEPFDALEENIQSPLVQQFMIDQALDTKIEDGRSIKAAEILDKHWQFELFELKFSNK